MTVWVYSGRPSEGAAALVKASNFHRMRKGKLWQKGDVVINWGCGWGVPAGDIVLNKPEAVELAVNKKLTFQILAGAGVCVVPWTTNKELALEWLKDEETIVCRRILTGHEGAGIIIVEEGTELPNCPLYTKYIYKVREFRVHATQTEVLDTQQKVRDPQQEPKSWKVRSYANGFIFQRKNIRPSKERDDLATQAIRALGLDFGALDIIEDKDGKFYVLEVNTAPGVEGQSIPTYVAALTKLAAAAVGE